MIRVSVWTQPAFLIITRQDAVTLTIAPLALLLLESLTKEAMVDYKGQALAERYMLLVFVVICAPAWVYGYLQQDFAYPFQAWIAATVLSTLLVLPNWGIYNRNPIKWLPSAMYQKKKKKD